MSKQRNWAYTVQNFHGYRPATAAGKITAHGEVRAATLAAAVAKVRRAAISSDASPLYGLILRIGGTEVTL